MHALVVGGTGMLRPVVHYLIEQGWQVSVIASTEDSLALLRDEVGGHADDLHTIAVDYGNDQALKDSLNQTVTANGSITLTVAWIHSSAPKALITIASMVTGDLFQVRSAGASRANYQDPFDVNTVRKMEAITYHRIVLGFQTTSGGNRWLTNSEIASGVIEVIKSKPNSAVVGVVEPWEQRPL